MEPRDLDALLRSIRPFAHPTSAQLRAFRAALSTLKHEGLIPSNVNVSRAMPYTRAGTKSLRDWLHDKDNQLVLTHEATTIAKSRVKDTQGFKVKIPTTRDTARVVVPIPPDAKVSVKNKQIQITHTSDAGTIKRLSLSRAQLKDIILHPKHAPQLQENQYMAFYVYGHKSHDIFKTPQQLSRYLLRYNAIKTDKRFFNRLELVTLTPKAGDSWLRESEERMQRRRAGGTHKYKDVKRRFKNAPQWKQDQIRAQRAEYMRKWRRKSRHTK